MLKFFIIFAIISSILTYLFNNFLVKRNKEKKHRIIFSSVFFIFCLVFFTVLAIVAATIASSTGDRDFHGDYKENSPLISRNCDNNLSKKYLNMIFVNTYKIKINKCLIRQENTIASHTISYEYSARLPLSLLKAALNKRINKEDIYPEIYIKDYTELKYDSLLGFGEDFREILLNFGDSVRGYSFLVNNKKVTLLFKDFSKLDDNSQVDLLIKVSDME